MTLDTTCTFVFTALVASLVASQGASIEDLPCGSFACLAVHEPVCGSDGITYNSECYMSWQQCSDPSLTVLHTGECKRPETTTRKVACKVCVHTLEYDPVCGSNGETYGNIGEFNCDKDCDRSLRLAHKGKCP